MRAFLLDWAEFKQKCDGVKTWQVRDAKNRLSRVVELARKDGLHRVTRQGRPVAVVVSGGKFAEMTRPSEIVFKFFSPSRGSRIELRC
jgi:prevent-host-death family protein